MCGPKETKGVGGKEEEEEEEICFRKNKMTDTNILILQRLPFSSERIMSGINVKDVEEYFHSVYTASVQDVARVKFILWILMSLVAFIFGESL